MSTLTEALSPAPTWLSVNADVQECEWVGVIAGCAVCDVALRSTLCVCGGGGGQRGGGMHRGTFWGGGQMGRGMIGHRRSAVE
jgi:hypothetical protein